MLKLMLEVMFEVSVGSRAATDKYLNNRLICPFFLVFFLLVDGLDEIFFGGELTITPLSK